jgi:hypothetical protein
VAFVQPPQPPPLPPSGNTAAVREANLRIHTAEWKEFNTYNYVEEIRVQQLLAAIHDNCTRSFKTQEGGYTYTAHQLIRYLFDNFGEKTDTDLDENKAEMKKPWNPKVEPIQAIFTRVDEERLFDATITEVEYVCDTKNIICKNDGFKDAFKTWEAKPANDKTWINLQTHFRAANKAHRAYMALNASTGATYPGSANSATTPGTTTTPPTVEDKYMQALAVLTKAVNKLTNTATTGTTSSSTTPGTNNAPRSNPTVGGRQPTAAEAANMTYCWSHGFCFKHRRTGEDVHTSANCKKKHLGHKIDATTSNMMGGECRIINSWRPDFRIYGNAE